MTKIFIVSSLLGILYSTAVVIVAYFVFYSINLERLTQLDSFSLSEGAPTLDGKITSIGRRNATDVLNKRFNSILPLYERALQNDKNWRPLRHYNNITVICFLC